MKFCSSSRKNRCLEFCHWLLLTLKDGLLVDLWCDWLSAWLQKTAQRCYDRAFVNELFDEVERGMPPSSESVEPIENIWKSVREIYASRAKERGMTLEEWIKDALDEASVRQRGE